MTSIAGPSLLGRPDQSQIPWIRKLGNVANESSGVFGWLESRSPYSSTILSQSTRTPSSERSIA